MASKVEGLRDFQAQAFPSWQSDGACERGRNAERPLRLAAAARRRTFGAPTGKPRCETACLLLEVPMSGDMQRWSKRRKLEVVMWLFRGESLDDVSRDVGLEISRLEKWRDKAMRGLEEGLREREGDPVQVALDDANRRIGELSMENELLRKKARRSGAFWPGRLRK